MFETNPPGSELSFDGATFVWVTNRGAAEITANSVASLIATGVDKGHRLIVVATDREASQIVSSHTPAVEIKGFVLAAGRKGNPLAVPEAYECYGSPGFRVISALRYSAICSILSATGRPVIYCDGDIAFIRSPMTYFERDPLLSKTCILAQNDRNAAGLGLSWPRQYGPGEFRDGSMICSGFTVWKPLAAHIEVAAAVFQCLSERPDLPTDQDAFNALSATHRSHVQLLRQDLFPNGSIGLSPSAEGEAEAVMFHANYVKGIENKTAWLKRCGLWLL